MPTQTNIGEERRLIFENYANGVDIENIMTAFKRSRMEVEKEIQFVGKKITEYRTRRCMEGSKFAAPPVQCVTLLDIRTNRYALLDTLAKLGDNYLSSPILIPKITVQKLDHPSMVREAIHRANNA